MKILDFNRDGKIDTIQTTQPLDEIKKLIKKTYKTKVLKSK